ncbi:hypothetical protein B0A50_07996 [Salinomyces thailandicus]|uniref:ABM domain-containing protein n=1 Tax=Salinomyces thailandicus TaxID=706561 RepID=A0A4U0TKM9_9PEZI|nr:hypothetical protein B0A50_07996 [Salinomyces thailandica]
MTTHPDLLHLKEVINDGIVWIQANEPETLEFSLWESQSEEGGEGVKLCLYASSAAMERHEATDAYKQFMSTMMEEELTTGAPVIIKGSFCAAFRR